MTPIPILNRSFVALPGAMIAVLAVTVLATSLFFLLFPGVDPMVSRWFYDSGEGFFLAQTPILRVLRASSTWVLLAVLLITLLRIVTEGRRGGPPGPGARDSLWLLAALVTGPGLLVNGLLKEHWGRPRPVATDLFGGDAPFQKVWVVSDWCERNCSFVSGEASSAAWLVAAALITPARLRPTAVAVAATYAVALSVNRIAFGGHYLSDVLLAWLLCALVFALLHRLICGGRPRTTGRLFATKPNPELQF